MTRSRCEAARGAGRAASRPQMIWQSPLEGFLFGGDSGVAKVEDRCIVMLAPDGRHGQTWPRNHLHDFPAFEVSPHSPKSGPNVLHQCDFWNGEGVAGADGVGRCGAWRGGVSGATGESDWDGWAVLTSSGRMTTSLLRHCAVSGAHTSVVDAETQPAGTWRRPPPPPPAASRGEGPIPADGALLVGMLGQDCQARVGVAGLLCSMLPSLWLPGAEGWVDRLWPLPVGWGAPKKFIAHGMQGGRTAAYCALTPARVVGSDASLPMCMLVGSARHAACAANRHAPPQNRCLVPVLLQMRLFRELEFIHRPQSLSPASIHSRPAGPGSRPHSHAGRYGTQCLGTADLSAVGARPYAGGGRSRGRCSPPPRAAPGARCSIRRPRPCRAVP
jgi:hypothetical protein